MPRLYSLTANFTKPIMSEKYRYLLALWLLQVLLCEEGSAYARNL